MARSPFVCRTRPYSSLRFMTRKIGNARSRGMPVCRGCEHGGCEHNWVSGACSNCVGRSPHCPFCSRNYERGRKRGQCQHAGCACSKYVPVTSQSGRVRPVNTYAARVLNRRRAWRGALFTLMGVKLRREAVSLPALAGLALRIEARRVESRSAGISNDSPSKREVGSVFQMQPSEIECVARSSW